MTGQFTGRHISAILIGFFAVVIAVNMTMARLAGHTFGGALAENGYVASQDYNRWIAKADAQDRLGWAAVPTVEASHLLVRVSGPDAARLEVRQSHPLGLSPDQAPAMIALGNGLFRSAKAIAPGRWQLHLYVRDNAGHAARFLAEVRT